MKVSVVIPTYNRSHIISRAIESAINQTYKDLEIIVVSDGSTDDTDKVLNEYENKDSRIKYISYSPNRGGNYARNVGIKAAKGEFIAFLDDDDEWLPDKIELQIKEFQKNSDIGLVYTGVEIIYDHQIKYNSLPNKYGDLSEEILVTNYIGTTSSVMVKTSILKQSEMFDENLKALQDYDLWIRLCQGILVSAVKKPLVKYYNFSNNKQISDDVNKYIDAIKYINEKYKEIYNEVDYRIRLKHEQSMYMLIIKKELRNNNSKSARKYLINYLKKWPNKKGLFMYLLSFVNYKTILKIRTLVK